MGLEVGEMGGAEKEEEEEEEKEVETEEEEAKERNEEVLLHYLCSLQSVDLVLHLSRKVFVSPHLLRVTCVPVG